jgi:hypothetical protein
MGRACRKLGVMRNAYRSLIGKLEVGKDCESLEVKMRIILKWLLH